MRQLDTDVNRDLDTDLDRESDSVASIVAAHAGGARSVTQTIRAALDRALQAQAAWNPFAFIAESGALEEALAFDARRAQGAAAPPLAGVPVSVKDILDVKGQPTRWGSQLFEDTAPAGSEIAAVARLRAAGAILIGKTTTTEFAHSPLGYSPLTGLTVNPFAPGLTCGGSSAGAGTSVAAGVTPITLTTDAGCSTRLPAACTGTFGLKPTLGLIPHERVPDAFGNFIHLGLLARHVADIAAVLPIVAGPQSGDPTSLRGAAPVAAAPTLPHEAPLAGKQVLLWLRTGNAKVSAEVAAATRRAALVLEQLGATVREADYALPHPDPIWSVLQQTNWAMRFAAAAPADAARLSPSLRAGIDEARTYSALDLQRAQLARTQLFRGVQQLLAAFDFILTPCVSTAPVAADFDPAGRLWVDGSEVGALRAEWTAALSLFDLTGHPAMAMPVGLAENGAPLGVQLVGRWYGEPDLLAAAAAFEAALPPPRLPRASGA